MLLHVKYHKAQVCLTNANANHLAPTVSPAAYVNLFMASQAELCHMWLQKESYEPVDRQHMTGTKWKPYDTVTSYEFCFRFMWAISKFIWFFTPWGSGLIWVVNHDAFKSHGPVFGKPLGTWKILISYDIMISYTYIFFNIYPKNMAACPCMETHDMAWLLHSASQACISAISPVLLCRWSSRSPRRRWCAGTSLLPSWWKCSCLG